MMLGRERQADPMKLLASQPRLISKSRPIRDRASKHWIMPTVGRMTPKAVPWPPCMHTCAHVC